MRRKGCVGKYELMEYVYASAKIHWVEPEDGGMKWRIMMSRFSNPAEFDSDMIMI